MALWIILIILVVVAGLALVIFNRIITLQNMVKNAWAQIDVQLQRRNDLIPNLVDTVKGYAAHEKELFADIARSRAAMMNATDPEHGAEAANQVTSALGRLFAVAEAYPDLKANTNFLQMQQDLNEIEGKIAYARQFFNDAVFQFNTYIQTIPGLLLAGPMGKTPHTFLEAEEQARTAPQTTFASS